MIDLYPNATLPILWILFMAVYLALTRFVFRPTLTLIEERNKKTQGLKKEADVLIERSLALLSQYEKRMIEARIKATKERESIIQAARLEERNIIQKAREENEAVLSEMQRHISKESKEATMKLRQYSQELARSMTDRILERKVA